MNKLNTLSPDRLLHLGMVFCLSLALTGARAGMPTAVATPSTWRSASIVNHGIMIVGCADFSIRLIDLSTHTVLRVLSGHQGIVNALAVDSVNGLLASKSQDKSIRIWSLASGVCIKVIDLFDADDAPIAFSRNGNYFAYTDLLYVELMDAHSWIKMGTLQGSSAVSSLIFINHDHFLVIGDSYGKTALVVDLFESSPVRKLAPDDTPVYVSKVLAAVDEGGPSLVTCFDTTVMVWRLPAMEKVGKFTIPFEAGAIAIDRLRHRFILTGSRHAMALSCPLDNLDAHGSGRITPASCTSYSTGLNGGYLYAPLDSALLVTDLQGYSYSFTGRPIRHPDQEEAMAAGFMKIDTNAYTALISYPWKLTSPEPVSARSQASRPGIQIQRGHGSTISSIMNSPDQRYIFSFDQSTVKIWDNQSQLLLRTLPLGTFSAFHLKCAVRDSILVLAIDQSENVMLQWWNWQTGIPIKQRILVGLGSNWYTEDGLVCLLHQDAFTTHETIVYDMLGDSVLRHLPPLFDATLSPGKDIAAAINSLNNQIVLVDYRSGRKVDSLKGLLFGDKAETYGMLKFSGNGRYFALAGNWGNHLEIWDIPARRQVYSEKGNTFRDFSLQETPAQVAISRGLPLQDENSTLEIRRLPTGELVDTLTDLVQHQNIAFLRYDKEGILYMGSSSGTSFIKDPRGRFNLTVLHSSPTDYPQVLRYDGATNSILVGVGGAIKRIGIGDVTYDQLTPPVLMPTYALMTDIRGQAVGHMAAQSSQIVLRTGAGPLQKKVVATPDTSVKLCFLDFGQRVLAYQSLVHKLVYFADFTQPSLVIPLPDSFYVNDFVRSHDGNFLAYCNYSGRIFLFSIKTRQPLLIDSGRQSLNHQLLFSADDSYLISYGFHTVTLIPTAHPFSGRFHLAGRPDVTRMITDPADPDRLISAGYDGLIRIWSIREREMVGYYTLGKQLTDLTATPEKNIYYAISANYELYRFDLRQKTLINTFYLAPDACLITDTLGNYMTTSYAFRNFGFTWNNNCYSLDQFDAFFNRPDKVLATFGFISRPTLELYGRVYAKRIDQIRQRDDPFAGLTRLPAITVKSADLDAGTNSLLVSGTASSPAGTPLAELKVSVNNIPLQDAGFKLPPKKQGSFSLRIPLEEGSNSIHLAVTDQQQRQSLEKILQVTYPRDYKPDIYFVGLGSSRYQFSDALPYVDQDIRSLCATFSTRQGSWFNKFFVDTLLNQDLRLERLEGIKGFLQRARVGDLVILFYSGHGKMADSTYYLASYDMDFDAPAQRGIPYDLLEHLMDSIKPRSRLLLINACQSGERDADMEAFQRMRTLFADLRPGNGATIVAASTGDKSAYTSESRHLSNFGAALQMAFAGESNVFGDLADKDGDGIIRIDELIDFIRETVRQLSHDQQVPTIRRVNPAENFRIW